MKLDCHIYDRNTQDLCPHLFRHSAALSPQKCAPEKRLAYRENPAFDVILEAMGLNPHNVIEYAQDGGLTLYAVQVYRNANPGEHLNFVAPPHANSISDVSGEEHNIAFVLSCDQERCTINLGKDIQFTIRKNEPAGYFMVPKPTETIFAHYSSLPENTLLDKVLDINLLTPLNLRIKEISEIFSVKKDEPQMSVALQNALFNGPFQDQ